MVWSVETIGALVTGFTALLTVLGTQFSRLVARQAADAKVQRGEIRELRAQMIVAESYMFELSRTLTRSGIAVPPPPRGLFDDQARTDGSDGEPPRAKHAEV